MRLDILPLAPCLKEVIWGGRGLQTRYGKDLPPEKPIGESWEVSAYPGMESRVCAGPLAGWTLGRVAQTYGADLMGQAVLERFGGRFPLLIKLLDARRDLSIQVHPDDAYARARGLGDFGKLEAWYVLHSEGGRIAYGLRDGVDRAAFEAAVRADRVEEAVRFYPVRAGDVVFIPPGTVHALCADVMVYEVQQSSDLTFRIWDYNRPGADGKPRELHIRQALEVMNFSPVARPPTPWKDLPGATDAGALLVASGYFRLERFVLTDDPVRLPGRDSFFALTLLSGRAEIAGEEGVYPVGAGDTVLVPAGRTGELRRTGGAQVEYLVSSV